MVIYEPMCRDSDAGASVPSRAFDTDKDAQTVQDGLYRRLGGRGRVDITFRLNETVRALTTSGIRQRHPLYTDEQVSMAYARLRLGDALMREVWPTRALVDP